MKKVGLITLGCDKNRIDGEKLLGKFILNGFSVVQDLIEADVIIVNTCGFIENAKKESIDAIFDAIDIKTKTGAKVVVTGCLAERYGEDLKQDIPEADHVLSLCDNDEILAILGEKQETYHENARVLTTPPHYAYLKIADGCNNHCAFCAIPKIRGRYISRPKEDIINEARELVEKFGVKELIVVAQDTTRYGYDLYGKYEIVNLLKSLTELDVTWVRLMYCYPELISDELIKFVAENDKMCKYLDIPMQHACDKILLDMKRRNNKQDAKMLIERIRHICPNISIRSTFMVGFPGEDENDFRELIDFLQEEKLDNVGFFAYSREEGTLSYSMKPQISAKVKKARLKEAFLTQQSIAFSKLESLVGKTLKVLYEGIDDKKQMFVARSEYQAPDIDGKIYFTADFCPLVGEYYDVKITKTDNYDLIGEIHNEFSK